MAISRRTAARLEGPLWAEIVAAHDVLGLLERGELHTGHIRELDEFMQFCAAQNIN